MHAPLMKTIRQYLFNCCSTYIAMELAQKHKITVFFWFLTVFWSHDTSETRTFQTLNFSCPVSNAIELKQKLNSSRLGSVHEKFDVWNRPYDHKFNGYFTELLRKDGSGVYNIIEYNRGNFILKSIDYV